MKLFFFVFIVLVIVQWYFKMKQTKKLHFYYNDFLETGNVLVERHKGTFSGAIIILQLDDNANILKCVSMSGATFWANWQECEGLINKNLLSIEEKDLYNYNKPLKRAIDKAIKSYHRSKDEHLQENLS